MADINLDSSADGTIETSHVGERDSVPWFQQFRILLHRCMKEHWRRRVNLVAMLIQNSIMGVLVGAVYFNIGNTDKSSQFRQPVLFFCVTNQGVFSALSVINSFPAERMLCLRERFAGTYYASAYFLAKNLADVFMQIFSPLLFAFIVYFMVGLQQDVGKFCVFAMFMILCSLTATSMAVMISALARTSSASVIILPMGLEICRLFGGFFLSPKLLPVYFTWIDIVSYVKYCYVGVSLNELSGLTLKCTNPKIPKCEQGIDTIRRLGMDSFSVPLCVMALLILIFLCRFVAFLGIRFLKT